MKLLLTAMLALSLIGITGCENPHPAVQHPNYGPTTTAYVIPAPTTTASPAKPTPDLNGFICWTERNTELPLGVETICDKTTDKVLADKFLHWGIVTGKEATEYPITADKVKCQEDEIIEGIGSFSNGTWSSYRCTNLDDQAEIAYNIGHADALKQKAAGKVTLKGKTANTQVTKAAMVASDDSISDIPGVTHYGIDPPELQGRRGDDKQPNSEAPKFIPRDCPVGYASTQAFPECLPMPNEGRPNGAGDWAPDPADIYIHVGDCKLGPC